MTDCDRCQQWEQICVPILDFLQAHPEVVGAKPGDSLTEKLLAFLERQVRQTNEETDEPLPGVSR